MIANVRDGGGTAGEAAGGAKYMVEAKSGPDHQPGERVLLVHGDHLVLPMVPDPDDAPGCREFAREIGAQFKAWSDEKRPGKDGPKALFKFGTVSFGLKDSEKLTPEEALRITREAVAEVMPGPRPAFYAVHGDTDALHVHFEVHSVDSKGKIYRTHEDWRDWERSMDRLEIANDLERVEQRKAMAKDDPKREIKTAGPSWVEIAKAVETGEPSPKIVALEVMKVARGEGPKTLGQFADALEAQGYAFVPNGKSGACSGYSVRCPDGVQIKGSDFGAAWSLKGLSKQGVTYEQDRDSEAISSRRAREAERSFGINRGGVDDAPGSGGGNAGRDGGDRERDRQHPWEPREGGGGQNQGDGRQRGGAPEHAGGPGIGGGGPEIGRGIDPQRTIPLGNLGGVHRDGDRHGSVSGGPALHMAPGNRPGDRDAGQGRDGGERGGAGERSEQRQGLEPTPAIKAQLAQFERFHQGLGADAYEIIPTDRDPKTNGKRTHGAGDFTPDQMREAIKSGRFQGLNAAQFDVYTRPKSATHHFILVDDLSREKVQKMRDEWSPAVVMETSKGNFQAVLRVPKNPDEHEARAVQRASADIAKILGGDSAATATGQPFRVPGFRNRKPGRDDAICVLDWGNSRPGTESGPALERVALSRKNLEEDARNFARTAKEMAMHRDDPGANSVEIEFKKAWRMHAKIQAERGKKDFSEIDFLATRDVLKSGTIKPEQVAAAIMQHSPGVEDRKGGHVEDYAKRTADAAVAEIAKEKAKPHPADRHLLAMEAGRAKRGPTAPEIEGPK